MTEVHLFAAFFKVGLLGFGGGMAILPLIYDTVHAFAALSPKEFADIVAIAQVTPGPIAVNAATYVGYRTSGLSGAALATLGVAVPAFLLVSLTAGAVDKYKENRIVQGALAGVRPAAVGLIAAAVLTIGRPTLFPERSLSGALPFSTLSIPSFGGLPELDVAALLIAGATILLIAKGKVNPFLVLLGMGCIGALLGV